MLINDWFGDNFKFLLSNLRHVKLAVIRSYFHFEVLPPQPAGCVTGTPLLLLLSKKLSAAADFFEYRLRRYRTKTCLPNAIRQGGGLSGY